MNNNFSIPFSVSYFINFNNMTFLLTIYFNYMKKINYKKIKFNYKNILPNL